MIKFHCRRASSVCGFALLVGSLASAGPAYVQTSASYTCTANASGAFSESRDSTDLGTESFTLADRVSGEYDVDARLTAIFGSDSFQLIALGRSTTPRDSLVLCSTSTSSVVTFTVPVSSTATLSALGGPNNQWSATQSIGGAAGMSATLVGPSGVLATQAAPEVAAGFETVVALAAGEYTLTLPSSTSSVSTPKTTQRSHGNCFGGVRIQIVAGPAGCNEADVAEPFGTLDIGDVVAFLQVFGAGCAG